MNERARPPRAVDGATDPTDRTRPNATERATERARDDARAVDGATPMSADVSSSGRSPVTSS
jgi:hypothetical protein